MEMSDKIQISDIMENMRMWKVLKMKMSGTSWPCEDKTLLEKWFIWQIMATRTSLANLKHCQVTAFYKHFAATRRYFAARRRYFPDYRRYFSAQRRYLMSILSIREKQPISSGWVSKEEHGLCCLTAGVTMLSILLRGPTQKNNSVWNRLKHEKK